MEVQQWVLKVLMLIGLCGAIVPLHAADAVLGAGDAVKITVFGSPELSLDAKVSDSGNISYPLLGEIFVEGLSAAQAQAKLAALLAKGDFVKKPQVSIQVTGIQSQQVSVLGFVTRPGRYPMDGRRSLLDVLALAGGVTPEGNDIAILIRQRDGKTLKDEINVPEMMRNARLSENIELRAGDVLLL